MCKNRGISYFIVLHRYCVCGFFVLHKLKVCGNLVLSKSTGTIFPIAFAHFRCHVLRIRTILQTFQLLLPSLSRCSVISDPWCYYCIVLGHHEPHPYKTVNLTDKCVCSDCSIDPLSPGLSLLLLLGPPDSLRHNNTEMRPINNPTVASKGLSERKNHTFLPVNQKTRND